MRDRESHTVSENAETLLENGLKVVCEGANIAGFIKVAEAMVAYGIV